MTTCKTKNSEKMKPCPFCGSKETAVYEDDRWMAPHGIDGYVNFGFYSSCKNCLTSLSPVSTVKEAIKRWNRRAAPALTTDPPTEPGWYWALYPDGLAEPLIVEVRFYQDELATKKRFWNRNPNDCRAFRD